MATTLIENLKSIIRNFYYFDGIKVYKAFSWKYKGMQFYVILSILQMSLT